MRPVLSFRCSLFLHLAICLISWKLFMASWNDVSAPTMGQAIIWSNSLSIYTFKSSKFWFLSLLSPTRFKDIIKPGDLVVNTVLQFRQSTLVLCCIEWYVLQYTDLILIWFDLSLCPSIHLCVTRTLSSHYLFNLGSSYLDQMCKRPWLRVIDFDLQGQIKLKLKIHPVWSLSMP